jgi:uridine kinase
MADASRVHSYAALADHIRRAPRLGRVRIVGVDGPAGAGKTTFADELSRALGGAPVVRLDDFLSWDDLDAWWPRFSGQVLTPLLAGRPATYQAGGAWRTVCPAPLVLIDGVTATRRAAALMLAYRVFVDAPRAERLRRVLAREGEQARRHWLGRMDREERFFAADRTRARADLLVDGAADQTPGLAATVSTIRAATSATAP